MSAEHQGWWGREFACKHESVALGLLAVVMFVTGVALIVWWFADRRPRRGTPPAATYDGSFAGIDEIVPGPGLSPETVTHFAHGAAAPGPRPGTAHRRP